MAVTWDLCARALLVALVVGCGGSDGGDSQRGGSGGPDGGGGGPARGIEASLSDLVTTMCGAIRGCCERDGIATEVLDACESELRRQWKLTELQTQVEAGHVSFDEAAFLSCLTELKQASASCGFVGLEESCFGPFKGLLKEGEACKSGQECESVHGSAYCVLGLDAAGKTTEDGVCLAPAKRKLGEPCDNTCYSDTCSSTYGDETGVNPPQGHCFFADGLYCDWKQAKCLQLVERGGACEDSEACATGNYCGEGGLCVTQKAKGEACQNYDECGAKMYCRDGVCTDLPFAFPDTCEGDYD